MNCTPQEIYDVLCRHDKILVTAHVSPDGDAIGSVIALCLWLTSLGKTVVPVIDDDIDDKFSFLTGYADIVRPDAVTVDDSWLGVVVDATGADRCGAVEGLLTGKVLNIDHHISNTHFADWEYIRADFAAAGEALTDLFLTWKVPITADMAQALYMATATDCGFFKFSNTTGHTLRMAAALVDAGARPNVISEHLEAQSLIKLRALSEVLKHIETYHNGAVAGIAFTPDVLRYTGEHTGGYIDYARSVKGVSVAFTVKYIADDETRISLRSTGPDVNAVAAVFGGGGHVRAAGCTIKKPMGTARKLLLREIAKVL